MGGVTFTAGMVAWCDFDPVVGREQGGRRPCVIVSSGDFTDVITRLVIAVPCTARDRGWANHILLAGPTGLARPSFAITEQPRTMSVERIHGIAGRVDEDCLTQIMRWVHVWQHSAA
jgi:mRNA interferase MazF